MPALRFAVGLRALTACLICFALLDSRTLAVTAEDSSNAQEAPTANPVFAFCYDTHDTKKRNLAEQAAMLRRIGFEGVGHIGADDVSERLRTLESQRLRLFLIGTRVDLTNPKEPFPATLPSALEAVKDRDVTLYVTVAGYPPSSAEGNDKAVEVLRKLARLADHAGVRVALYPHTGDWLVEVKHAIELARRVDDENLGVIFNLCHWMKNEDLSQLEPLLDQVMPYLFAVTINGADAVGRSDPDWHRLIQPLDRGSYDVRRCIDLLRARKYKGPVGIMCYGIAEDAETHLSRSLKTWREWSGD